MAKGALAWLFWRARVAGEIVGRGRSVRPRAVDRD
jgi:hypothetical protein